MLVINVFGQAPGIQWQKSFGGTSDEFANAIESTKDGGYILAGYTQSTNNGNVTGTHGAHDFWVVKIDAIGNLQWQHSYGGTDNEDASAIKQTLDSGYVVVGYSKSNDGDITAHHGTNSTADCWIIKLNKLGIIQWEKSFGGTDEDFASSVQQTADSGFVLAGLTQSVDGDVSFNHGNSDYWVLKLNAAGTLQWEKTYGGTAYDNAISIQRTINNSYVVTGSSNSIDGDVSINKGLFDYWVLKLNSIGVIQWEKSYGGTNTESATSIKQTNDSGYVISGYANSNDGDVSPNYAGPEYWIVKTDSLGTIQWEKSYGGQGSDDAYDIEQTVDGGYIVAGSSASTDFDVTGNHGVWDSWIIKLSNTGIMQWEQSYGGPWDDGATMIHQTSDGGYIFSGHSMLTGGDVTGTQGAHDFWIVKLNATVGLNELSKPVSVFIYPNPTNDDISFELNESVESIIITDALGKAIDHTLIKKVNNQYIVSFNSNVSKGIYFIAVRTNNGIVNSKFIKE